MIDFSKLLTTLAEDVSGEPNMERPKKKLPSEVALTEVAEGMAAPHTPVVEEMQETVLPDNLPSAEMPVTVQRESLITPIGNTSGLGMQRPSTRDQIAEQQERVRSLEEQPIAKQSLWKDIGAKLIQGADAFFNGNRAPIVGYGRLKRDYAVNQEKGKLASLIQQGKYEDESDLTRARTQTIFNDDRRQAESAKALEQYRLDTVAQREAQRKSVERNTKMRTVASMLNKMPSFDPTDPRMESMTKALGDIELPVTPRDAKKNVKPIQDAETGAWTLVLTDPVNGQQEVRPILTKDGQQLVTTSTAKVAADAADDRLDKSLAHREKMAALEDQYRRQADLLRAKLKEAEAVTDQTYKLQLQREAETLRQEGLRLRYQLDELKNQ